MAAAFLVVLAAGAAALWFGATAFLIIFAGVLLAALLDQLARALEAILPLPRYVRLAIVILAIACLLLGGILWGSAALIAQFGELIALIETQINNLTDQLSEIGLELQGEEGRAQLRQVFPDLGSLFGGASQAVLAVLGGVGNFALILFLGVFFAAQPGLYKRGLVSLVTPARRRRVDEVLDETGHALRWWLIGQMVSMAVIFVLTLVILWTIGMPFAFTLALQAGLLAFVPTIGAVVAGVPIVLAGMSVSPAMALWGLAAYLLVQAVESNILQPLVQQRAIHMPPALTLGVQLVLGVLFGVLAVVLAVPLAAVVKVLVERLYVEDRLGGSWRGD